MRRSLRDTRVLLRLVNGGLHILFDETRTPENILSSILFAKLCYTRRRSKGIRFTVEDLPSAWTLSQAHVILV